VARKVRITAQPTARDYTERFDHFLPGDRPGGRTLQSYREEFGPTLEGEVRGPFGSAYRVSLAALGRFSPDTYIKLQFVVSREGEDFGWIHPDAIVLKEFELPEGTVLPGT